MLILRLLGSFRLENETSLLRLRTHKGEALLAFLVLHSGAHSREKLAAKFWADSTDTQARASLRTALGNLRQQLGAELFLSDHGTIQINAAFPLWVDAREFEMTADELRRTKLLSIGSLSSAVELYRGELLVDFYDEWIFPERAKYRALHLEILLRLSQEFRLRSDHGSAIEYARKILAIDPTHERAQEQLMSSYVAGGDRMAALKQYEESKRVLRAELDVEPSAEITAFYHELKSSAVALKSDKPHPLKPPVPLTSLVGRKKEIEQIQALVARQRLVTLTGAGGSGKTRLAIQIATDLFDAYIDRVAWVELGALSDPALVPHAVAKAWNVREVPNQPLTETLLYDFHAKHALFVLDNCEHLIEACATFSELLLQGCPNVKILATSREPLGIVGEHLYHVPMLGFPQSRQIAPVQAPQHAELLQRDVLQFEAPRLFFERARAVKPNLVLDEPNARAIAQICQRLDGMPLAIELAAARVQVLSLVEIAERLNDRFNLLTHGSRTALPRHQTLIATLDWSHDLLTEPERILFRRLAVLNGDWTLEAANTVCADDTLPQNQVLNVLSRLVDKSLVVVSEREHASRYHMLETIHEYAYAELSQVDQVARLRERHFDYFSSLAQRAAPQLGGPNQRLWIEQLEMDLDNLRAALSWSLQNNPEAGVQLATALGGFWMPRGDWSEGRRWYETLLASGREVKGAGPLSTLARARVLCQASLLALNEYDLKRAQALSEESLACYHKLRDDNGPAMALNVLSWVAYYRCDYHHARALADESLELARQSGSNWENGLALDLHGDIARAQGEYASSTKFYQQSLELSREIGDIGHKAYTLAMMALSAWFAYDLGHATALAGESLALARELREDWVVAYSLNTLGDLARTQGDYSRAQAYYDECQRIHDQLGIREELGQLLCSQGWLARIQGEYQEAARCFTQRLKLWQEVGNQRRLAECFEGLAGVAVAMGKLEQAVWLFGSAEAIRQAIGSPLPPVARGEYESDVASARAGLNKVTSAQQWANGASMPLEQTIELALSIVPSEKNPP